MNDLCGLRPHRRQGVVSQLSGVPVGSAVFGLAPHLTNSGIHINSHRIAVWSSAHGPDPPECFTQGLVHLADMTPCERTKKRAQCGRGHHPKRQRPVGGNRPAADQHDRYGNRPPAWTPPKTAPCDPDRPLRHDLPAVQSRPATVPTPTGTSTCPLPTTPHRQPTTRHRTPPPTGQHPSVSCSQEGASSFRAIAPCQLQLFSQTREALPPIYPPNTPNPSVDSGLGNGDSLPPICLRR